jgi:DNA polymerase I-like protein with 3'-5' exonuclease and polymerase domains
MLKSKHHNGAIIEIDIKSLEPRLYLSLIKGIDVEDAYSFLSEEVLKCDESISRKDIKLAFISLLYGASQSKIKKITALKSSDIKKIRDYLEVSQFKNKIEKEFNEKGHFENAYGRKIYSINAPVNYYIQSTAADFSCLLYENLMQKIPNDIDLIGVIHDAIILDCQPIYINSLMKVKYCVEDIINRKAYFSVNRHS